MHGYGKTIRGPHNPLSLEEKLRIHEMNDAGVDKDIIAAEFKVTRKTVNSVLKEGTHDDVHFDWEAAKDIDPVQLDTREFVPYNDRPYVKKKKAEKLEA